MTTRTTKDGRVVYYATWTHPASGKRCRRQCTTERAARRIEDRMRQLAYDVKCGIRPESDMDIVMGSQMSTEERIDEYIHFLGVHKGNSDKHNRDVRRSLARTMKPFNMPVNITAKRFMLKLEEIAAGKSDRTWNAHIGHAQAFCEWMTGKAYRTSPLATLSKRTDVGGRSERTALTKAQGLALMALECPRRPWYALTILTGLRWTEAAQIQMEWVDHADRTLKVPKHVAKTKTEAVVPLCDSLVIPMRMTGSWAKRPRLKTFKRDMERAGITPEEGKPISTRHTFATWLTEAGVQEDDAARLMRHAAQTMTRKKYIGQAAAMNRMRGGVRDLDIWLRRDVAEVSA